MLCVKCECSHHDDISCICCLFWSRLVLNCLTLWGTEFPWHEFHASHRSPTFANLTFLFFFKFCSEWQENNLNYLWPSVAAQPWGAITSREIGTTAPCRKGLLSWAWEHDAICIAPNPCNEMQWQDCAAHACVCMCMHVYATSCQSHNSQTLSNICLSPVDTVEPKLWWFCLWGFHLFWQP